MKKSPLLILLLILFIACGNIEKESSSSPINLQHVLNLVDSLEVEGENIAFIYIYADAPDYKPQEAVGEGIACVDDVARAAVVYLRYYEITGIDSILARAKRLLNFVLYMQADDGEFYNFIDSTYQINKTYRTSRKSFDFWAARGY